MKRIIGTLIFVPIVAFAGSAMASQAMSPPPQQQLSAYEFVAAAKRGDENAVRKALDEDSTLVNATDAQDMTALDWAATRQHWHIFRQLLDKGAPVNIIGSDGGTVLHRVAHYDKADMLALLIDAGGDISHQNQWGRAPLHVAARRGCLELADLLLTNGANPNVTTNEGWTPLHVAYRSGQPEMVDLLLAGGADPRTHDDEAKLPAEHAFQRPAAISIEPEKLYEYQGLFDVDENFHFKVWVKDGNLLLQDFGADELYAFGADSFYCASEPWQVTFQRDENNIVNAIEVQFLRRAVLGVKREHPLYVGSDACRGCHIRQATGNQYVPWLGGRHAAAYWRLATDWSLFIALSRPHFQDMENPREDARCLLCHTTGAQDPNALFAATYDRHEGIGCETCHGPGSLYSAPDVMTEHTAFVAAGGRVPDESTCQGCHRNPDRFSFDEWWPRVEHGNAGSSGN